MTNAEKILKNSIRVSIADVFEDDTFRADLLANYVDASKEVFETLQKAAKFYVGRGTKIPAIRITVAYRPDTEGIGGISKVDKNLSLDAYVRMAVYNKALGKSGYIAFWYTEFSETPLEYPYSAALMDELLCSWDE